MQDTTLALDFRVTALEENGGVDGNSSVAELEVRVETLEGTAADHETRISAAEVNVEGKAFKNKRTLISLGLVYSYKDYYNSALPFPFRFGRNRY